MMNRSRLNNGVTLAFHLRRVMHFIRSKRTDLNDQLKMVRYYGLIADLFCKFKLLLSSFGKKHSKSPNYSISANSIDCKHSYSKNSIVDFRVVNDLHRKLKKSEIFYEIPTDLFDIAPSIVFLSNYLPRYDRTSADFRLYNILKILSANKCKIHYVYCKQTEDDKKYARALARDISLKLLPPDLYDYTQYITQVKPDYVWMTSLWRIDYVRFMAQLAEKFNKQNRTFQSIIDTVDFHFKEFIRKYEYTQDHQDLALANEFLKYEKILYLRADTVVVVSENEKRDIQDKIPGINNIQVIPNINKISISTRPYHKRRNICFVGNFGNKHNVDAVRYFLKNIYEFVGQKNPREHFHILGRSSEKYRKEFSRSNVKVIGQLKNLHKALTYYKLFVCPMTYGAGLKGKIGDAIAAGVPVVTTPLGAEGFPFRDGVECFIADSPFEFAEKCNQCLMDPVLWHNFSVKSKLMIAGNFSPGVVAGQLKNILIKY